MATMARTTPPMIVVQTTRTIIRFILIDVQNEMAKYHNSQA